jgi:hypothetical protein
MSAMGRSLTAGSGGKLTLGRLGQRRTNQSKITPQIERSTKVAIAPAFPGASQIAPAMKSSTGMPSLLQDPGQIEHQKRERNNYDDSRYDDCPFVNDHLSCIAYPTMSGMGGRLP